MNDLTNNIYQTVSGGGNVLLVGPTNSGKTWYINNILIPFLKKKKIEVVYFSDPDNISEESNKADVIIVDEVELLIDQDKLEAGSSGYEPYYSGVYLKKVKTWHNKLQKLTAPSIFILTRNNQKEISNIVDNVVITDWGSKVKCLAFDV
ncbi:MAG TPA: ATP-binding protein [bacterium]|nr:ATP-binding protein [bacterium]